jgi:hypothetical protein
VVSDPSPAAPATLVRSRLPGDEFDRYQLLADASILIGDGTAPPEPVPVVSPAEVTGSQFHALVLAVGGLAERIVALETAPPPAPVVIEAPVLPPVETQPPGTIFALADLHNRLLTLENAAVLS